MVVLKVIDIANPWQAFLIPVSIFPIPEQELMAQMLMIETVTKAVSKKYGLLPEIFIQFAQLHIGDAKRRLATHGRDWIPTLGLGVWPDRPAPALWTREEFMQLQAGDRPRRLMHQVFRITSSTEDREKARNCMLGLGTVLQIMIQGSSDYFFEKTRESLLPPIRDASFMCFPFYVPLLERKSLAEAVPAAISNWLCGAQLYFRESPEDQGILLISSLELAPILMEMGGSRKDQGEREWHIPV